MTLAAAAGMLTTSIGSIAALAICTLSLSALAADGNRLAYLDGSDPFYVSRSFPKLITPQWVGEDGVEAVVDPGDRRHARASRSGRPSCGRSSSG